MNPSISQSSRSRLVSTYPLADSLGLEPKQWCEQAGVPLAELNSLMRDSTFFAELEAEKLRAELDGRLLTPKAQRIALKALSVIETQIEGMDPFEAAEMLKHVHRILDAYDRREAAKQMAPESLLTVSWVINGGAIKCSVQPPLPERTGAPSQPIDVEVVNATPRCRTLSFPVEEVLPSVDVEAPNGK
jgi:hypothetical protein